MTLAQLMQDLENLIQDTDFTDAQLKAAINRAYAWALRQVKVPSLKRMGSIQTVTDASYVSLLTMDSKFRGWISIIRNTTVSSYPEVYIYPKLEMLYAAYEDLTLAGDVVAVAVEGSTLWYMKRPETAQTLTMVYYADPEVLDYDSDVPSYIPEHLHYPLLVNGAGFEIFSLIEDGTEDQKANTFFNQGMYEKAIAELHQDIGRHKRHFISSRWEH